jgi:hypothetical protein
MCADAEERKTEMRIFKAHKIFRRNLSQSSVPNHNFKQMHGRRYGLDVTQLEEHPATTFPPI